ncbi:unnamed protein product [Pleuronectes platessa]|uniref:Uncharacterized protein n=1 Tax=Pleuronectes platessa TaxID=8262 RepID=A0A9N7Y665_PLEPL|nr:unnamed protein product [Pleuronectes platessa]
MSLSTGGNRNSDSYLNKLCQHLVSMDASMDVSGETVRMNPGEEVPHRAQEEDEGEEDGEWEELDDEELEDLELEEVEKELANMTVKDVLRKVQAVQTDATTEESVVNTEPDWESQVSAMLDYSVSLSEEYGGLKRKQGEEEAEQDKHKQQLQKKKEEAARQHQAVMDKLESVRVKLQLNNSKAIRKNFLSKKQEMTSEKDRAEEEKKRYSALHKYSPPLDFSTFCHGITTD